MADQRIESPTIGVGVVGASPGRGWAALAHIPALQALPGYDLRAVSTSRPESAAAAEQAFGVAAYHDHRRLVEHAGIDLVVVSVRVPHHREIISAALDAGKMVYSEWPLATSLEEAAALAQRAQSDGVRTAVGLQARFSPAIERARVLVEEGYVGTPLATTLVGSGMVWGPQASSGGAYMFDEANGVTTLTVPTLHALDALIHVLGPVARVSAETVVGRDTVSLIEDGSSLAVTAPDQVAIVARLAGGAPASVFFRGGSSRGENLRWEINGTEGDLVLTADHGNIQAADVRLQGGRGSDATLADLASESDEIAGVPPGPARNVARLYEQFARDLRDGTHVVPDFADAVTRHHLVEAVRRSARDGSRERL